MYAETHASHSWREDRYNASGVVVRASDLQPRGHRFESRNYSWQVVHTHVPLFTKRYKLVPAKAGS